jgi:uncharacterized protein
VNFLDTGPLLARRLSRDPYHNRAVGSWNRWAESQEPLATTILVLGELITLMNQRAGVHAALRYWRDLLESPRLEIIRPESADETLAMRLLEKIADPAITFTDYISFAVMQRRRIRRAFTFDQHFCTAGFEIWE